MKKFTLIHFLTLGKRALTERVIDREIGRQTDLTYSPQGDPIKIPVSYFMVRNPLNSITNETAVSNI